MLSGQPDLLVRGGLVSRRRLASGGVVAPALLAQANHFQPLIPCCRHGGELKSLGAGARVRKIGFLTVKVSMTCRAGCE